MTKPRLVLIAASLAACGKASSTGGRAFGAKAATPALGSQAAEPAPAQEPQAHAPASGLHFTAVSVGLEHACAVDRVGDLYCWGEGSRLDGSAQKYEQPFRIDRVKDVTAIAVGDRTFAVTKDGDLVCLGCTIDRLPLRIGGLSPVRSVATKGTFVCALERAGAVKCWNWWYDHYKKPEPVVWPELAGASAITVGDFAVCALVGGRVVCQHKPEWKTADNPTATQDSQPGRRVDPLGDRPGFDVVSGDPSAGCASGTAGMTCWYDRSSKRQVHHDLRATELTGNSPFCAISRDGARCFDALLEPSPARPLIEDATHVSIGMWETCAVTARGALLCWGGISDRKGCDRDKPCPRDVK
jgi:hypothetical protein